MAPNAFATIMEKESTMKLNIFALLLGTSAVVLTSCETPYGTPDRTATGALMGGALGAASGALIGGRHAGEGALIGGALGAVTGGLIGHSMDQEAQARLRQQAPETYARVDQGQPLSLADVKALAAAKLSDDVIVSQIRNSRSVFHLGSADIIDLKNSGVDEKVIDFMINTPTSIGGTAPIGPMVAAGAPPPAPVETVVVAPGPGYVWVDGEWTWNGGWVWVTGHWLVPPYPHAVWVRGGWVRGSHGYRRVPGHWR
jgi:outer membrane lipoprotein SlyB